MYEQVDARMDSRRKRRRELKQLEELKKARREMPKISDQFADLKGSLQSMSDAEWDMIPDIGDYSLKYKTNTALQKRNEMFAPVPDSLLGANAGQSTAAAVAGTVTPGVDTPSSGMASSVTAWPGPEARSCRTSWTRCRTRSPARLWWTPRVT